MNVEDTWRSFLMSVSLGINYGLLEFIKEINETRADMANEQRMQKQYEILSKFGNAADGVINSVNEEKKTKAGMFISAIERTMEDGSGFPDSIKEVIARAMERCVIAGKNYEAEKSFEEAIDTSDIPEEDKMEYKASYRNAMEAATARRQPFYVFQVDIDDSRAPIITASVEKQLREQGYPAVGFFHDWNDGKCFIHVFDADTAARAKAVLEYELCRRSIDNIRSEESLQAIATITGQDTVTYEGLSQAAAGKMYELASGKHFPVYIAEGKEGSYNVMFLSDCRKYAEKLLAESIVQTSGYSHKAGLDHASELRQTERERIREYIGKVWAEHGNSVKTNLGYIVDTNPKHEGNRIVFGKDSVTHITQDGKETRVSRSENPLLFEDRVRNMVENFAKDFVLIPAEEAAKFNLYNETFQLHAESKEYIKGIVGGATSIDKKLYRDALIEQRFFSWAIKNSPADNAYGIFKDIQVHLDERISEYRKAELRNIDRQFQSSLRDTGSKESAEKIVAQRKESFTRDFERFFGKENAELKVNLGRFLDQVKDNLREMEPNQKLKPVEISASQVNSIPQEKKDMIREAVKSIDEPISSNIFGKSARLYNHNHQDIHSRFEEFRRDKSPTEHKTEYRGDAKSDIKERTIEYYGNMQIAVKAGMAQRSHKPLTDPYIVECSKRYVYVQNAMDTLLGNSVPYFNESRKLADFARMYVYVLNDRKVDMMNIPRDEYVKHKDELLRVMMRNEMDELKRMFSQTTQREEMVSGERTSDLGYENGEKDLLEEEDLFDGMRSREDVDNEEHS